MQTHTDNAIVCLPDETYHEIHSLYQQGLYLRALRLGEEHGPLPLWSGPAARVMAARLAINLGAPLLSFRLNARAWREAPFDPETCYFYGLNMLDRRGPLTGWKFLQSRGDFADAAPDLRANWLSLHGRLAGRVRDFSRAEDWLRQAEELCPELPWIFVERSSHFEFQDRYDEALAAAKQALQLRPWYRPAVQATAHILQLMGRDQEALQLLTEASEQLESGGVLLQLALLQRELGEYALAKASFERMEELSPLLEKEMGQWLAVRQCEAAYLTGDYSAAAEFAKQVEDEPYHKQLAERLSQTPVEGKRHVLPVGFVRQHQDTCVPASLTTVSRFWSMPADHLEIAAEICYDGTPAHNERRWAEENGWIAREFTVKWDASIALLDRGVPYTLTLVEPTFAHLQACIGYDSIQQTLVIRDPGHRYFGHYYIEPFLERYQATGPRGMALVPKEQAHLLDGLELPDAKLYDRLYELNLALTKHEREQAGAAHAQMQEVAPNHYLTWHARRVLAIYDADRTELMVSVEGLLKLFPEDAALQMHKVNLLRDLVRRDEHLDLLRTLAKKKLAPITDPNQKKPEEKHVDPVFLLMYAQALSTDARRDKEVERQFRRLLHIQPGNAQAIYALANVWWAQRRFDEALELYRWAACLEDKDERLVQTWFNAARHMGQTDSVLAFLKDRFARFGAQSSAPAQTLFWAYSQLDEHTEAFAVLESAKVLRPDDGDLLLYAAHMHANHGDEDQARELLAAAEKRVARAHWLRTAAHMALLRGEHDNTLDMWREIAKDEPLAVDAHREIAMLLTETDRGDEALAYMQKVCERFPHHYSLHQLWIEMLRREGAVVVEPVIRKMIDNHPDDAWARREMALTLGALNKLDEAFAEADISMQLDPTSPPGFTTRGQVHLALGRVEAAKEDFRQALRLSVDFDYALDRLIGCCDTLAERREAFAFVMEEIEKQVIFGDVLLIVRDLARHTLEPKEVLAWLNKAHAARPDLWQSWSAVVGQLLEMKRTGDALDLAKKASARFPLLPAVWLDLARVHQAAGDTDKEITAIKKALQINRSWGTASRQLAAACERAERNDEAKAALETAIELTPMDSTTHGTLADLLWRTGEKEAALERVQQAIRLAPGYEWAWNMLSVWSQSLDKPDLAVQAARDLTEKRPREARSWMMLARMLPQEDTLDERLAAVDKAIELNPRLGEAYDVKAEWLAKEDRFDDALAVCNAPVWDGRPPLLLRGRVAWLTSCQGDMEGAIKKMRAVVEEDPAYYWGWKQLADWSRASGTDDEYLQATDMLVRLAPDDAISHGYQGEARLRKNDRAGAKKAFRQAVDLLPDYGFAGLFLFDLYFEDEEREQAKQALTMLQTHVADEFVQARTVEFAAKYHDKETAVTALTDLCCWPQDNLADVGKTEWWPLLAATDAMSRVGWGADVDRILGESLTKPKVVPAVAAQWLRRRINQGDWNAAKRLPELLERGPVGESALLMYVQRLGETQETKRLQQCIRQYREPLTAATFNWGKVGYALTACEDYATAVRWLSDYDGREDLKQWMLLNLVIALRATGKDQVSSQVVQRALELPEQDVSNWLRVWLAFDEALAGRTRVADDILGKIDISRLDPTHDFLWALVAGMIDLQDATANERGQAFTDARRALAQAAIDCSPLLEDRPAVLRAYRQAIRRMAADHGGLTSSLWATWRGLFPVLPKRLSENQPAA